MRVAESKVAESRVAESKVAESRVAEILSCHFGRSLADFVLFEILADVGGCLSWQAQYLAMLECHFS